MGLGRGLRSLAATIKLGPAPYACNFNAGERQRKAAPGGGGGGACWRLSLTKGWVTDSVKESVSEIKWGTIKEDTDIDF